MKTSKHQVQHQIHIKPWQNVTKGRLTGTQHYKFKQQKKKPLYYLIKKIFFKRGYDNLPSLAHKVS